MAFFVSAFSRARFIVAFLITTASLPALAASPWSLHDAIDAPTELTLSGSARMRFETLKGQPRAGLSVNDSLTNSRVTLLAGYKLDWVRLGAEIYDSRAFGAKASGAVNTTDVDALEPVQAYATFGLGQALGVSKFDVQAGRFLLPIGFRRLLGAEDTETQSTHTRGYALIL